MSDEKKGFFREFKHLLNKPINMILRFGIEVIEMSEKSFQRQKHKQVVGEKILFWKMGICGFWGVGLGERRRRKRLLWW